ncbi:Virginiamycin B lyase [Pelomyxa schiedti]|nr:Virginiamycin B lyase [Pelomyxa schiedti]
MYGQAPFATEEAYFDPPQGSGATQLHGREGGRGHVVIDRDHFAYVTPQRPQGDDRWSVRTIAGKNSVSGFSDGIGSEARFSYPSSIGFLPVYGDDLIVSDNMNSKFRRLHSDGQTQAIVTTIRSQDPPPYLVNPSSFVGDDSGNIFVIATGNHSLVKIDTNGLMSFIAGSSYGFADGCGSAAKFHYPWGVILDRSGNFIVTDVQNNRIRKITPDGTVTTLAGNGTQGHDDGPCSSATFNKPCGIALDCFTDDIYISDMETSRIRKITSEGLVFTVAGYGRGFQDGQKLLANFSYPRGMAFNSQGALIIADSSNNAVRALDREGNVTTLVGGQQGFLDGLGTVAQFNNPTSVAIGRNSIYVSDFENHCIRELVLTSPTTNAS